MKSFTQQEALPDAGIARAVELMQSGRLHRYDASGDGISEAALLEREFAAYQGSRYALACASGGYALHIALLACGVRAGELVLTNAFTLAPVPGAIHNAGGEPVLVEIDENCTIDLDDLERKAAASGAKVLLLSHMRGHIADMGQVTDICARHGVTLIEDCAHTMGARWKGRRSGTFGKAACFSTQSYKHLNSGEGGLLTSDDSDFMARATLLSGSYMLYDRHGAVPDAEAFEAIRLDTPNYSGRMDNLRAALLRPQLEGLDERCARWNALYNVMANELDQIVDVTLPKRATDEDYVGSSIQFFLPGLDEPDMRRFLHECAARGVDIKWFGDAEPRAFTSRFDSWRYIEPVAELPATSRILAQLCDLRLPLTFTPDDCRTIAAIIGDVRQALSLGHSASRLRGC